jgi:hypothetical protein
MPSLLQGERIDWGSWAITSNDPTFRGSGNADTGEVLFGHIRAWP